jgi:hypothetical protein
MLISLSPVIRLNISNEITVRIVSMVDNAAAMP